MSSLDSLNQGTPNLSQPSSGPDPLSVRAPFSQGRLRSSSTSGLPGHQASLTLSAGPLPAANQASSIQLSLLGAQQPAHPPPDSISLVASPLSPAVNVQLQRIDPNNDKAIKNQIRDNVEADNKDGSLWKLGNYIKSMNWKLMLAVAVAVAACAVAIIFSGGAAAVPIGMALAIVVGIPLQDWISTAMDDSNLKASVAANVNQTMNEESNFMNLAKHIEPAIKTEITKQEGLITAGAPNKKQREKAIKSLNRVLGKEFYYLYTHHFPKTNSKAYTPQEVKKKMEAFEKFINEKVFEDSGLNINFKIPPGFVPEAPNPAAPNPAPAPAQAQNSISLSQAPAASASAPAQSSISLSSSSQISAANPAGPAAGAGAAAPAAAAVAAPAAPAAPVVDKAARKAKRDADHLAASREDERAATAAKLAQDAPSQATVDTAKKRADDTAKADRAAKDLEDEARVAHETAVAEARAAQGNPSPVGRAEARLAKEKSIAARDRYSETRVDSLQAKKRVAIAQRDVNRAEEAFDDAKKGGGWLAQKARNAYRKAKYLKEDI